MPTLDTQFLGELKTALLQASHFALASQVDSLRVYEFVEGRRPISQFIYVRPKSLLPAGELGRIIVGGVPGLLCLLVCKGQIAVVETLSRDVFQRET